VDLGEVLRDKLLGQWLLAEESLQALLQYSPGIPFQVGFEQPAERHCGVLDGDAKGLLGAVEDDAVALPEPASEAPESPPPAALPNVTSRQSLEQYSPGRPFHVGFPQPVRPHNGVVLLHCLLQNSLGKPFHDGFPQPRLKQTQLPPFGSEASEAETARAKSDAAGAAGGCETARWPTKQPLADRTTSCHCFPLSASRASPVTGLIKPARKEVQALSALSSSLRSIN